MVRVAAQLLAGVPMEKLCNITLTRCAIHSRRFVTPGAVEQWEIQNLAFRVLFFPAHCVDEEEEEEEEEEYYEGKEPAEGGSAMRQRTAFTRSPPLVDTAPFSTSGNGRRAFSFVTTQPLLVSTPSLAVNHHGGSEDQGSSGDNATSLPGHRARNRPSRLSMAHQSTNRFISNAQHEGAVSRAMMRVPRPVQVVMSILFADIVGYVTPCLPFHAC